MFMLFRPSPVEANDSDDDRKPRKRKAPAAEVSTGDEVLQQLAMLEQVIVTVRIEASSNS